MKKKILIVEDDKMIVESLQDFLRQEGFDTVAVSGQADAGRFLNGNVCSILLVDVSLSDGNGFLVCRMAKEKGLPVIFLTASSEENSVVRGFDNGADDYIAKPFRPRELISRINNVLRRYGDSSNEVMIKNIKIDFDMAKVWKDGSELTLSALEYRLLSIFANNRGTLLTRDRLLDEIWDIDGDFVNDNTLTVYIKRLREKIEEDPQNPQIIKTVRGMGYRIEV